MILKYDEELLLRNRINLNEEWSILKSSNLWQHGWMIFVINSKRSGMTWVSCRNFQEWRGWKNECRTRKFQILNSIINFPCFRKYQEIMWHSRNHCKFQCDECDKIQNWQPVIKSFTMSHSRIFNEKIVKISKSDFIFAFSIQQIWMTSSWISILQKSLRESFNMENSEFQILLAIISLSESS